MDNLQFDTSNLPFKLYGYRTIKQKDTEQNIHFIYHKEIGYGGGIGWTLVAVCNKTLKQIRPSYGYYAPHKTGKSLSKKAKTLGFKWVQY